MATVTPPRIDAEGDQIVVMHDVGWSGYSAVLKARGDRCRPKIIYLDGDVSLVSPAYSHERLADRLGLIVKEIVVALRLPCISTRSTTFRRKKRGGGGEADESFYLANAERIRGRKELQLRRDPPPDLVVEAVNTHAADESVEVWRRFRVPEVWVCDGRELVILVLQDDGQYATSATSATFPFLPAAEILEWAVRESEGTDTDTDWMTDLRKWVAETLVERHRQHPERVRDETG